MEMVDIDPEHFFGDRILSRGVYLGFAWLTAHNSMGYRCGYVRLPAAHPWYSMGPDRIPAEVHFGLTFAEAEPRRPFYWIGFDCAHAFDMVDLSLPMPEELRALHRRMDRERPLLGLARMPDGSPLSSIKTLVYVEAQCLSLCAQAAAALVPASADE